MKEGIHPNYRPVVFKDPSADYAFITRSTIKTEKTITWEDGKEYPLVTMEISSASHPFYTGRQKLMDTAGRVERFAKRFAKTEGKAVERKAKTTKAAKKMSDAAKKAMKNAPTVVAPLKRDRDGGGPRRGPKSSAPKAAAPAKTEK
jgi:large subunit ribosomal protein L31